MKISQIFQLGKLQPELDFVDVNTSTDMRLFLDPYFLGNRSDPWCLQASNTIRHFFQAVIDSIRANDNRALQLLTRLHEPNETCLGFSEGHPQGRGIGRDDSRRLHHSLAKSRAIQTGLVSDIEDCHVFIPGIGVDKLSDMTTGIIRKHLIDYTQHQAKLNGIPLQSGVPSGFYWDPTLGRWDSQHTEMLVVDDRRILLVPKGVVSFRLAFTPDIYYNDFILTHLQNENLTLNTVLVQKRRSGKPYVTKESLKERNPYSREFLLTFTENNPEVFRQFRDEAKRRLRLVEDYEISPDDIPAIATSLIQQLKDTPTGPTSATMYHRLIAGILELLFYPYLMCPKIENDIHQGRKRIDIVYDNSAKSGIFWDLHAIRDIHCPFVMVECKNYSSDPANPELDQLIGRLSNTRGRCGILVCRRIEKFKLFMQRCKDTFVDGNGLIIPIQDQDLFIMLGKIATSVAGVVKDTSFVGDYLRERANAIMLG